MDKRKGEIVFGKKSFVGLKDNSLLSDYDVLQLIGEGSFGKVYRVKNKISGLFCACKQLHKKNVKDKQTLANEIEILMKADHANIIKLYNVYEDKRYIYIVMEECTGGELYEYIINQIEQKKYYSEQMASKLFRQLMLGIAYCHGQNICHRDIKPQNLLLLNNEEPCSIKIIDFGLSQIFKGKMVKQVGTSYYASPEVIKGNYSEKCDIWSSGVILYFMLCGILPFMGPTNDDIYEKICNKQYSFTDSRWKDISLDAKDLITHMLCDASKRYSAMEVLEHPWIKNLDNTSQANINFDLKLFKRYVNTFKLKKIILMYIASRVMDKEIAHLKEAFQLFDENKDGTITFAELEKKMETLKLEDVNLKEIFESMDTDHSGRIDYTEFIAASLDQECYLKEEKLYAAFKEFDKDNTGKISKEDLMKVLKLDQKSMAGIIELINEIDKDNDNQIDYNEFITMMSMKESDIW